MPRKYDESVKKKLIKGLSQGAIISPILYNIYTREIDKEINKTKTNTRMIQFADDIATLTRGPNMGENKKRLEETLQIVERNLGKIKLEIFKEKTNCRFRRQGGMERRPSQLEDI